MSWQLWFQKSLLSEALEEVSLVCQAVFMAWQMTKFPDLPPSPLAQMVARGHFVPHAQLIQLIRANDNSATAASRALPWQRVAGQCHPWAHCSCPAAAHEHTSGAWTHTEWGHEGEAGGQEGRKGNQMRILTYTCPKNNDAVCMQGA